ncbi:sigma-70 family RNA polymerase sigma factor [Spirosoma sp. HMF4905]|uniref:Sigma-70 family RNA polymerase sigma factor n=1 Tax=Spirosoma arboris TaxID=2682092 RepID=A0A7K1SCX6_9BACT|nr:sigma-70 family RNA polymerase sigma factor [Spirosoma arboris]MVM31406.1 sigma-70 family RNA polymerase sigma factor [Spirosoma arboris]
MEHFDYLPKSPQEAVSFSEDEPKAVPAYTKTPDDARGEQEQWGLLQKKNASALAWFYQQYGRMLHNYGYRLVPDKELVKDTIQDLFVQLWNNSTKLPAVTSVKAYLIVALRRELLRRITRQRQFTDVVIDAAELSAEEQLILSQTDDQISEGLAHFVSQLPSRQREIIFLKYYSALSTEEIASVMELTSPSVYKLIYKALNNLKQLCAGWEAIWVVICLTFYRTFF